MNVSELEPEVREYIENIEQKSEKLQERYDHLLEEFRALLHRKYGRTSEQYAPSQPELFHEEEQPESDNEKEEETTDVSSYRRKKKAGRKPLSDMIPREEIVHDIPEEDKVCACGSMMIRIGEEISERLCVIPEQIYVEKHIRPKYGCRTCEGSGEEEKAAVRIAPAVPSIIPGSIVTPGLLAFILVNKFCDHLPFYRQEKRFERIGVHISRQNMSNWTGKAFEAIRPLMELLEKEVRSGPFIRMDETTVQVMQEEGREDTAKSYMWLTLGGNPERPVALYHYRRTRAAEHITEILGKFHGYLQTDGYEGYDCALKDRDDIIHVGCFAHARRKFFEAAKASKKAGGAEEAMGQIGKLYQIESELRAKELSKEEFLEKRKELAEPILKKFRVWLEKKALYTPPSVLLGKAVQYTLNQWDKLVLYLDSPLLTPDNNLAENAIRPFVLGRKNWLFSGSPHGAESSCAMYSLIETAKLNNLNPYEYLRFIFDLAPRLQTDEEFTRLLPWKYPVGEN